MELNDIYNIIDLLSMFHKPLKKTKHLVSNHYLVDDFLIMPVKAHYIEKKRQSFVLVDNRDSDNTRRITHVTPYVTDQLDVPKT